MCTFLLFAFLHVLVPARLRGAMVFKFLIILIIVVRNPLLGDRACRDNLQCSEICGVQHGFMPIVIESVDMKNYLNWLLTYENS